MKILFLRSLISCLALFFTAHSFAEQSVQFGPRKAEIDSGVLIIPKGEGFGGQGKVAIQPGSTVFVVPGELACETRLAEAERKVLLQQEHINNLESLVALQKKEIERLSKPK